MNNNFTHFFSKKQILFFLVAILFAFTHSIYAHTNKTVSIGYFLEPGMMDGAYEGGVKSGYVYDYIQQIATHTGWKYQYVYGSFEALYEKLLNGEIDMLPYVNYVPERVGKFFYPNFPMGVEQYYLASFSTDKLSDSLKEVEGKKIGATSAAFFVETFSNLAKQKGVDCEVVGFHNTKVRWEALKKGEIDFSIESSTVLQQIDIHAVYEFVESSPFYLVVSLKRPDLLDKLNEAHKNLIEIHPGFLGALQIKYFMTSPLFKNVSSETRQWLDEHKVINIGTFDKDKPFAFVDKEGNVKGIAPDTMKVMLASLGVDVPVKWKFYSGKKQCLEALKNGEIDLCNPYYHDYGIAESDEVIISSVFYTSGMSILYKGDFTNETMSLIATPNTRLGANYVAENYPDAKIIPCLNGYDCIDKLLAGKANSVIVHSGGMQEIVKKYNQKFNIHTLNTPCNVCFATIPENAGLISMINKGVPFLSGIELNKIESNYFVVETKPITLFEFIITHKEYALGFLTFVLSIVLLLVLRERRRNKVYTTNLEAARQQAEEASLAKTNFLFNMSHDIRTPMNAIIGFTNMAIKDIKNSEKALDCLNKIQGANELLLSIINDILDMSRIESGKVVVKYENVNLENLFMELQFVMQNLATQKEIELTFEMGQLDKKFVFADVAYVNRILINLISNAIKYTLSGGKVKVVLAQIESDRSDFGLYKFVISDNGIGMSQDFQKHMFEEFSREENSTVSGIQGTGLGLPLAKKLAELMGGNIECLSLQGEGSTFTVVLPFKLQTEEEIDNLQTITNCKMVDLKGKKVLLVEDNEFNREIGIDCLEEQGLNVEIAVNGLEAVKKIEEKGPDYYDFILMDIQMPIMDGFEATKEIRRMFPNSKIIIIAVSANAFEEDRQQSLSVGMNEHVSKPFNINELKEKIASLCNKK